MKILFSFALLLTFAQTTILSANDGGFYYLDVENIKNKKIPADDIETKVVLSFEGKDAAILAKSLPADISVDELNSKTGHSLVLKDEKSNRAIVISCTSIDWECYYSETKCENYKLDKTRCSITMTDETARKTEAKKEGYDFFPFEGFGHLQKLEEPACKQ